MRLHQLCCDTQLSMLFDLLRLLSWGLAGCVLYLFVGARCEDYHI